MTEHEEFLTIDDSKQTVFKEIGGRLVKEVIDLGLDIDDIEKINNHFDNEYTRTDLSSLLNDKFDDELIGRDKEEKDIHYLKKSSLIQSTKNASKYRRGFTKDVIIVERVLSKDDKWRTEDGMKMYKALNEFNFSFNSKGTRITLPFKAGDVFLSSQKCEDKEMRKELLGKSKK